MKKSQEPEAMQIRTLKAVRREFQATFEELSQRTDVMTALQGLAFTIVGLASTTPSPRGAIEEFKNMLDDCYSKLSIITEKKRKKKMTVGQTVFFQDKQWKVIEILEEHLLVIENTGLYPANIVAIPKED